MKTKKITKEKDNKKVNKKMTFSEAIDKNPKIAVELANKGMFCCGCPMAMQETLEQGAEAHGIDVDELIKELNKGK